MVEVLIAHGASASDEDAVSTRLRAYRGRKWLKLDFQLEISILSIDFYSPQMYLLRYVSYNTEHYKIFNTALFVLQDEN